MNKDSPFRLIPVIDLKGGLAVHAVAGKRDEYRMVEGALGRGDAPVELAVSMTSRCGTNRLYVADLDAIAGLAPHFALVDSLVARGLEVWLDAGITGPGDAKPWLKRHGNTTLVLGLETVQGPKALADATAIDPNRIAFSLDLVAGEPRMAEGWSTKNPEAMFRTAAEAGVTRMLAIDLARVGTASGPWGENIVHAWQRSGAAGELLAGGGVRGRNDLDSLAAVGFHGALVATALHRGAELA